MSNEDGNGEPSLHRPKVTFKCGGSSMGSKEVSNPSENDFFANEFSNYERQVIEQEELLRSENEEEGKGSENEAEEDAPNAEVTSNIRDIRVRRGKSGKFEKYAEGSSSSAIEPKKKNRARGKDSSWLLSGPAPGGPLVHDVIPSFAGHIAYHLWSHPNEERKILTKYTRDRFLVEMRKWKMGKEARKIVDDSGLSHLVDIMHKNLNMPLLCAFIERWQPDTNTFHMPWGEMTILLHDVKEILGIPIDGLPCNIPAIDLEHPVIGISGLLGMPQEQVTGQFSDHRSHRLLRGSGILISGLKELVEGDDRGATAEAIGFLMLLIGSSLFVDKTSDRVSVNTFHMLKNVGGIKDYAWGAGTLAYLYRQLGIATRIDCRGICGCLTLLQTWIYEYFPPFRPTTLSSLASHDGAPRASLWTTAFTPSQDHESALKAYRLQIDRMPVDLVTWTPYCLFPENKHPRTLYTGLLRFVDILEPYQPDRCLRQFGYMQIVPSPMAIPDKAYRPTKSSSYELEFSGAFMDHTWSNWRDHKIIPDRLSLPAHPSCATVGQYTKWYESISHPHLVSDDDRAREDPTARSYFPTTVGYSLITRLGKYSNVDDPNYQQDLMEFMRPLQPQIHEYAGRGNTGVQDHGRGIGGSGAEGRRSGRGRRVRQRSEDDSEDV